MCTEQLQRSVLSAGRVVITLTGAGGVQLAAQAQRAGWQAALWPGLTFGPTGRQEELLDMGSCDWVVLTSPQGVRSLTAGLSQLGLGPQALAGLRVAAVGEGTARPLAEWGRVADFVPGRSEACALAAELPAAPGEKVLHVTGEESRDRLQVGLEARGILYQQLPLYRSWTAVYSPQARRDFRQADWTVVASGVVARGLAQQLGPALPLLAMGEQTAQAAREAGFVQVVQAHSPSLTGILETLLELPVGERRNSLSAPL